MKINPFMTIIALCAAALLSYLVFLTADYFTPAPMLFTVVSAICFGCTLVGMVGLVHNDARLRVNIKVASTMFLIFFLFLSFGFALLNFSGEIFAVICGLLLLFYISGVYRLSKIKFK